MPLRSLSLVLPALAFLAAPAAASEIVLEAANNYVLTAWANNQVVRLRVDPETPGNIVLNRDAAWRIRLYPSGVAAATIIGPVRVEGNSRTTRVTIGSVSTEPRIVWTPRQAVSGADGLISPTDLPYDRVIFRMRPPASGERQIDVPMLFEPTLGLFYPVENSGQFIHFRMSLLRRESLATAAAGALMASEFGGSWAGTTHDMLIKYGVVRPVRPLSFERPWTVAGLPLSNVLVRTSDHRGNALLPSEEQDLDADEIVVTAMRGGQIPRYIVSLGTDWLGRCSSMTWNNRTGRMTLSCA